MNPKTVPLSYIDELKVTGEMDTKNSSMKKNTSLFSLMNISYNEESLIKFYKNMEIVQTPKVEVRVFSVTSSNVTPESIESKIEEMHHEIEYIRNKILWMNHYKKILEDKRYAYAVKDKKISHIDIDSDDWIIYKIDDEMYFWDEFDRKFKKMELKNNDV